MCDDFPSVDKIMERRSDAETLINRVTGILKNHPFLSDELQVYSVANHLFSDSQQR